VKQIRYTFACIINPSGTWNHWPEDFSKQLRVLIIHIHAILLETQCCHVEGYDLQNTVIVTTSLIVTEKPYQAHVWSFTIQ